MLDKFATSRRTVWSEFLDLSHTSKAMMLLSLLIPKFALAPCIEVWRTSDSGHE
jgi:hypothetical protein